MIPAEIAEMVGDKDMVLIGSILVFAYISGFVLSEISRWLDDKKSAKSMKNKRSEMIDSTVGAKVLKDAIKKSKLMKISNTDSNWKKDKKLYSVMYNAIQNDEAYKRIHNYASVEVLSKNLALAALLAGIECAIKIHCGVPDRGFYIACLLICCATACFMEKRKNRFAEKKMEMTIVDFVDKYSKN